MGVMPSKQMKLSLPLPNCTYETASVVLCTKKDVLCPDLSRDEAMFAMTRSSLPWSWTMPVMWILFLYDFYSSRKCLVCLFPMNQALVNRSVDQAVGGSIGSKTFGWIKIIFPIYEKIEKSHKSTNYNKKNHNILILYSGA